MPLSVAIPRHPLQERLHAMSPTVAWPWTVPPILIDPEWNLAAHEESAERGMQVRRESMHLWQQNLKNVLVCVRDMDLCR